MGSSAAKKWGKSEIYNIDRLTELIVALLEGAYHYPGPVDDQAEYNKKAEYYKEQVIEVIKVRNKYFSSGLQQLS